MHVFLPCLHLAITDSSGEMRNTKSVPEAPLRTSKHEHEHDHSRAKLTTRVLKETRSFAQTCKLARLQGYGVGASCETNETRAIARYCTHTCGVKRKKTYELVVISASKRWWGHHLLWPNGTGGTKTWSLSDSDVHVELAWRRWSHAMAMHV